MSCDIILSKLFCCSGPRQDSDSPSILSLFSLSLGLPDEVEPLTGIAWHFLNGFMRGLLLVNVFVGGSLTPLGLLRVLSSTSSNPQLTRKLYILPCDLPILIILCSTTFCELSLNLWHMLYNHILLKTCGYQFLHSIAPFQHQIKKIYL